MAGIVSAAAVICFGCGSTYMTDLAPELRRCPYADRHTVAEIEALKALGRELNAGAGKKRKRS